MLGKTASSESRRTTLLCAVPLVALLCIVGAVLVFLFHVAATLVDYLSPVYQFKHGARLVHWEEMARLNVTTPPDVTGTIHIHQMWKDSDVSTYPNMPSAESWKGECELAPNCVYHFWTDATVRDTLLKDHFPGFEHPPFPLPIQFADLARWLVLYEYGGVYVDLDAHPTKDSITWLRRLSRIYPVLVPSSAGGGGPDTSLLLSNHFLMARDPRDPLVDWVLHSLAVSRDNTWLSPIRYLRVMATTGSIFLTKTIRNYLQAFDETSPVVVGVVHDDVLSFFVQHAAGRSWHSWDGRLIAYIGDMDFTLIQPMLLGLTFLALLLMIWRRGPLRARRIKATVPSGKPTQL